MNDENEIKPIELPLKLKYRVRKAPNKGSSKKNNSGGVGRKAKAEKRAVAVSAAICPEQYGLWAAWCRKNGFPILG